MLKNAFLKARVDARKNVNSNNGEEYRLVYYSYTNLS